MMGAAGGLVRLAAHAALVGVPPLRVLAITDPLEARLLSEVVRIAQERRLDEHRHLAVEIANAVGKLFRR